MKKGKILQIETMGLVDGPGVRVVVFMYGCPLRCKFCHNPESWTGDNYEEYTVDELYKTILRYKPYFENGGGVTVSGGEPFLQTPFILELFKKLKEDNIHTCIDTSGVGMIDSKILDYTDLLLLDVKSAEEDMYYEITGLKMDAFQKFVDDLKNKYNQDIWVRQVIIPDVNDTEEYIKTLAEYIKEIPNIKKIELLPFEKMGSNKYEKLGLIDPYKDKEPMNHKRIKELEEKLHEYLGY